MVEKKHIREIAEALGRTQDATRNRLYELRVTQKKEKDVSLSIQMTAEEYNQLRDSLLRAQNAEKATAEIQAKYSILKRSIKDFLNTKELFALIPESENLKKECEYKLKHLYELIR